MSDSNEQLKERILSTHITWPFVTREGRRITKGLMETEKLFKILDEANKDFPKVPEKPDQDSLLKYHNETRLWKLRWLGDSDK